MWEYILYVIGGASFGLTIGAVFGYITRQNIAKFQIGSLEQTLQKRLTEAKSEAKNIIIEAKRKAFLIAEKTRKNTERKEWELTNFERQLGRKQGTFDQKLLDVEAKNKALQREKSEIERLKEKVKELWAKKKKELEKISGISKDEAKKEILTEIEKEYKKEFEHKFLKLEKKGEEKLEGKAKEILAFAIQRMATSSINELTTASVALSDDEIKGRIIGKEGRNIRAFEEITGVELVVDETPGVVFLSSFDPLRREIAKISLEKLIKDGRIQPSRIEKIVEKVREEMPAKVQKIGEKAAYDAEVFGLDPKLHRLLGRLRFRTSFGQNVLSHSLEVAYLASALADELGIDSKVAKKAGLLHDIGKAVDHQIEGSHVEIGIKILEKFGIENEIIKAMRSHHEEYPYEGLESLIVQTADAISASRPGVRKDNTENYLKRLEELEKIAMDSSKVKNAYAIEAGREIRVFVKSEEIDDFESKKLAKSIAKSIEEELNYPGEIKVNVIRETRAIEYAR